MPIEYKLYPLKNLEKFYKTTYLKDLMLVDLEQAILNQVIQEFDEISMIKQENQSHTQTIKHAET